MTVVGLLIPLPPKAKARPRVTRRGTYMPADYQAWRAEFTGYAHEQLRKQGGLSGKFAIGLTIITPSGTMRPDLDNVLGAVLDALQDAGAIENDRLCHEVLYVRRAKEKRHALRVYLESVEEEPAKKRARGKKGG